MDRFKRPLSIQQNQIDFQYSAPTKKRHLEKESQSPIFKIIKQKMEHMHELHLNRNNLISISVLQLFDNSELKVLNLNDNLLISLKGLEKCNFLSLQILYARHNYLKETQPFHIYEMPKIKEIYLNKNDIANIRVPKIAIMTCPFLNFIQFNGNPYIHSKIKPKYIKT